MTVEQNRAMATRFFEELLDSENFGILNDLFTEDCLFHRGDLTEPARGIAGVRSIVEKRVQLYRDFPNDNSSSNWRRRLGRHPRDP
jgi:hypothetical protein